AVDHEMRLQVLGARVEDEGSAAFPYFVDAGPEMERASRPPLQALGEPPGDSCEVDDAGGGHVESSETSNVRFQPPKAAFVQELAGDPVGFTTARQLQKSGDLSFARGYDDLAANFVGDAFTLAEREQA